MFRSFLMISVWIAATPFTYQLGQQLGKAFKKMDVKKTTQYCTSIYNVRIYVYMHIRIHIIYVYLKEYICVCKPFRTWIFMPTIWISSNYYYTKYFWQRDSFWYRIRLKIHSPVMVEPFTQQTSDQVPMFCSSVDVRSFGIVIFNSSWMI